jgi:hypothetical protein
MDPYLEIHPFWSDFVPTFIAEIRNALLALLLPRYDVRMEECVMLTENDYNLHRLRRDVTVSETASWEPAKSAGTAIAEPVSIELDHPAYEPFTQRRLKIIRLPHERVVTAIEVLSPTNEVPGEGGLDAYLEKRAELLTCQCNLVELDLLRGGQRLPMSGPLPPADYYALIGRVGKKPRCHVVGWSLRAPLPIIDIPLLAPDPDIQLDLQSVFRAAYESAFYDRRLRYNQPLEPPVRPEDEAWLHDVISSVSRRS